MLLIFSRMANLWVFPSEISQRYKNVIHFFDWAVR